MSYRRRPAAPGQRPPSHPIRVRRRCVICSARFTLNRRLQPWARARTCSAACRVALANRGRNAGNCTHCSLVESYYLARDADVNTAIEIAAGDERAPISFRDFLCRGWAEQPPEEERAA